MKLPVLLLAMLLCGMALAEETLEQSAEGIASYYSDKFHGRRTANDERYDRNALTAASNRYPLGALVRVTYLKNSKSVVLRINDRMQDGNPRLIDVSRRAAKELGFQRSGLARVRVEVLSGPQAPDTNSASQPPPR